ncbi:zinc ribbon domain-containing protein [Companilactobacillus baiquanensis]|uniref:Zinc-ribbon domain-containing protein n=1 Tax=Companilactobacillus baiquanensis TaxID=2486005 RepID=A0ABW1UVJ1_9LACO|nr:zinc ribbon domain-containing protein [Companilactobacillus baiquanensis]
MKCPNCGADITAGQKFCNKCGFDLTSVAPNKQAEPKNIKEASPAKPVEAKPTQASNTSPILGFLSNNPAMIFVFVLLSAFVYCFYTDIGIIIFVLGILGILYLYSKNGKSSQEIEFNKTIEGIIPLKGQNDNKFLLLEFLAYGANIIAIFKLPILDLTDIFKLADSNIFTSAIGDRLNDIFNGGNISLYKFGTLISKLTTILSSYYKDDKTSEATELIRGLTEIKWGIYVIIFCALLAIVSKFIKNYEIPAQLIAGAVPTLIFILVYFRIKNGGSDYAVLATFLGSGFYLALVASVVLVITSLIRIGKNQKKA